MLWPIQQIHGNHWLKLHLNHKWCRQMFLSMGFFSCFPWLKFSLFFFFTKIYSGNVIIETKFYDDDLLVSTTRVRLFYIWIMMIRMIRISMIFSSPYMTHMHPSNSCSSLINDQKKRNSIIHFGHCHLCVEFNKKKIMWIFICKTQYY